MLATVGVGAITLRPFLDPLRAVIGGTMKVIQKDPRVPFKLTRERETDMDRQVAKAVNTKVTKMLTGDAPTAVPIQYVEALVKSLKAEAVAVLKGFHDKKMAGRLAQWLTTCRLDGCEKQPRKGRRQVQTKRQRRTFVFCPGHAGIRNMIAKSDYQRLKSNANLRVVA